MLPSRQETTRLPRLLLMLLDKRLLRRRPLLQPSPRLLSKVELPWLFRLRFRLLLPSSKLNNKLKLKCLPSRSKLDSRLRELLRLRRPDKSSSLRSRPRRRRRRLSLPPRPPRLLLRLPRERLMRTRRPRSKDRERLLKSRDNQISIHKWMTMIVSRMTLIVPSKSINHSVSPGGGVVPSTFFTRNGGNNK